MNIPMIRIQIRTPSPSPHLPRSGALVFDLHDVVLSTGSAKAKKSMARFTQTDLPPPSSVLLSAECRRILIGCSPAGGGKATAVTLIGPLVLAQESSESVQHVSELGRGTSQTLKPFITLSRSNRLTGAQFSEPETSTTALALSVDIPSVNVQLSKALLDHIQYWADDVTQLIEGTFGGGGGELENADSRDTSLIGSRYFARSRRSDSDSGSRQNSTHQPLGNETVIKVAISEGELQRCSLRVTLNYLLFLPASIRLMVPRERDNGSIIIRPVDIFGSDVDILMEMKPAGKVCGMLSSINTRYILPNRTRPSLLSE
jgi:autophagy-related protein 2